MIFLVYVVLILPGLVVSGVVAAAMSQRMLSTSYPWLALPMLPVMIVGGTYLWTRGLFALLDG